MEITGTTLDDVMQELYPLLLRDGSRITSRRGDSIELLSVTLRIHNPLARLSRSLARGKRISCIGELCWYLAGSDALDFIIYYLKRYEKEAVGSVVPGAYGPRLKSPIDQLEAVFHMLSGHPTSRRAVVVIYQAADLSSEKPPCTATLQFLIRDERLHLITTMRSNDAVRGLLHDVFAFTMLQELMARRLSVPLGHYVHFVASMHIYDDDVEAASSFLEEGWQQSQPIMPPMPEGDPVGSVRSFLEAEAQLRSGVYPAGYFESAPPYWADLGRLLALYAVKENLIAKDASEILASLHHQEYSRFYAKS